jgi:hypothetical protein
MVLIFTCISFSIELSIFFNLLQPVNKLFIKARVAEQVDARDLKSLGA